MDATDRTCVLLVGDIGGTKTNIGYFSGLTGSLRMESVETFSSQEASGPEEILERFVRGHRIEVKAACLGVAGPVMQGRCRTTNLPWEISEESIRKRFGWSKVKLVNDLAATAMSLPLLGDPDKVPLNEQSAAKEQAIALIAPGTGLGQCLLAWLEDRYVPIPSEGGHTDFAPTDEQEVALWRYLHEKLGHVSVERLVSGPGLVNIYTWLKTTGVHEEPHWLAALLKTADLAAAISEAGLEGKHPLCVEALDRFVSIMGSVAGNLALTGLARGGVYLAGGIAPKILPKLKEGGFLRAFADKGRFKGLLEKIPVWVIRNDKAALLGAARCAVQLAR